MEKFVIDLDKVLDDFELCEDQKEAPSPSVLVNGSRPSHHARPFIDRSLKPVPQETKSVPFQPVQKLDLSEADFPSHTDKFSIIAPTHAVSDIHTSQGCEGKGSVSEVGSVLRSHGQSSVSTASSQDGLTYYDVPSTSNSVLGDGASFIKDLQLPPITLDPVSSVHQESESTIPSNILDIVNIVDTNSHERTDAPNSYVSINADLLNNGAVTCDNDIINTSSDVINQLGSQPDLIAEDGEECSASLPDLALREPDLAATCNNVAPPRLDLLEGNTSSPVALTTNNDIHKPSNIDLAARLDEEKAAVEVVGFNTVLVGLDNDELENCLKELEEESNSVMNNSDGARNEGITDSLDVVPSTEDQRIETVDEDEEVYVSREEEHYTTVVQDNNWSGSLQPSCEMVNQLDHFESSSGDGKTLQLKLIPTATCGSVGSSEKPDVAEVPRNETNTGARPKNRPLPVISTNEVSNEPDLIGGVETGRKEWEGERLKRDTINQQLAQQRHNNSKLSPSKVKEIQNLEIQKQLLRDVETAAEVEKSSSDDSSSQDEGVSLDNEPVLEEKEKQVRRPTSLPLPGEEDYPPNVVIGPPGCTPSNPVPVDIEPSSPSEESLQDAPPSHIEELPKIEVTNHILANISEEEQTLGKIQPFWIPDSDALSCMLCDQKFTVIRRRHHCRACGKVLCSQCCSVRARLDYLDNKEARVCSPCLDTITRVQQYEEQVSNLSNSSPLREGPPPGSGPLTPPDRPPNPNNPAEYCSTIPPHQQVGDTAENPLPVIMVPVGVLKRGGSTRPKGEPKQVMFSDGIRPGGDLTELDGSSEPRPPYRRSGRVQKKVDRSPGIESGKGGRSPVSRIMKTSPFERNLSLLPPGDRLPPIVLSPWQKGDLTLDNNPNSHHLFETLRDEDSPPVVFALNKNLFVLVKILTLDCCVNRQCWCFTTRGMCLNSQDEIVIVLECLQDESVIPRDIFAHINTVWEEAGKGNVVSEMGHTILSKSFLGSRDYGGFLYIRPTFQCLHKLVLPPSPYLVAVLLQKWETPWAKVFPIRLMLRLGAEFRYYPCPLVSVRNRKCVFGEIGHTIMNLLADFRNFAYMLPTVKGFRIHMEDRQTTLLFPRNRYDQVVKALNNSNDHVLALGANLSTTADSHLVCIQNEDGNYQTQAINIQNKPRKVTGASFVVFNGALKSASGLTAKSSIVEDGLMVQIHPDTMLALRSALRTMTDFTIGCGPANTEQPDELVLVQWIDDDRTINVGVKSPVDNRSMTGISSIKVHNGTDYLGDNKLIRWTEVFLIQTDEALCEGHTEPTDISRLSETLSRAVCLALSPHLDSLKSAGLTPVGVRVTLDVDVVCYEVGSNGEKLPPTYMNDLDSELVPVIHRASSGSQCGPVILELIFHILEQ